MLLRLSQITTGCSGSLARAPRRRSAHMSRAAAPTPQNVRPDDRPRGVETRPGGLAEREAPHGGFANRIRLWKLRQLRPACRRTTTTGSELSTRARGGTGARARSSARCSATGSVPVCGCWTRALRPRRSPPLGGRLRLLQDDRRRRPRTSGDRDREDAGSRRRPRGRTAPRASVHEPFLRPCCDA